MSHGALRRLKVTAREQSDDKKRDGRGGRTSATPAGGSRARADTRPAGESTRTPATANIEGRHGFAGAPQACGGCGGPCRGPPRSTSPVDLAAGLLELL